MAVLLVLAGPIVRRVYAPSYSSWVALAHAATISPDVSPAIFGAAGPRGRLLECVG